MAAFRSILFDRGGAGEPVEPAAFKDLNLDQLVADVTLGRGDYDLAPFFHAPLRSTESIGYRHEILRDLEHKELRDQLKAFARRMVSTRVHLGQAQTRHYPLQQQRWFLSGGENYCSAVTELAAALGGTALKSRGLVGFREYLAGVARSEAFRSLAGETHRTTTELAAVRYRLHIKGNKVMVARYDAEPDYSAEIEQVFARFKQGAAKDYRVDFPSSPDLNHVEAGILARVASLYPDTFTALTRYRAEHADFVDPVIATFDREVQFYLAYLEYLEPLRSAGLPFCYPVVTDSKAIRATGTYDLALAAKLVRDGEEVVRNDFELSGPERILVVTGPNQGGKTTFARSFGQLHHLASLGLPVPGESARLLHCDRVLTHFEKEEDLQDLRGRLQDDLVRVHAILREATGASIVILNEIFASTTLQDATVLGRRVLAEIAERDLLCVCVTFVDELASLGEATVSMVSAVDDAGRPTRTYKLSRRPANGMAYAATIAAKYRLSYDLLKERLSR